jgi:hypothetical protein
MTPYPSRTLRGFWAVLALVQLFAAVSAPLADAALQEGGEAVVHIESEGGAECGAHHDHLFCQLCRAVDRGARQAPSVAPVTPPRATSAPGLLASAVDAPPAPSGAGPVGSRAPPRG